MDQDDDDHPLSRREIALLREIIDRDRRAAWLWASARVWALWIAAVIGAWTLGWDALTRLVRHLSGKS